MDLLQTGLGDKLLLLLLLFLGNKLLLLIEIEVMFWLKYRLIFQNL